MFFWKKWYAILPLLLVAALLLGCGGQQQSLDNIINAVDQLTENMLVAMNENDYNRFSRDFDDQMRVDLDEAKYKSTVPAITAKIGKYLSKDFVGLEKKDQYTIVVYRANFSLEPDGVTVRSVVGDKNDKKVISGFWLDSPKLRGN
ncbi:DUF3887 domain-containing protein [Sporomusa malonica]|uniref:DUF3887 domain-containing protein n=1 Tax=Sporomusa malonica TaxID=112901 RepID=A0A1W2F1F8_9FIRM|nr:DUF3887 domain-containing protein [Sporomusa malonica]SMD15793.1 Protein of unknown function [Sporomusa malonica]